MVDPTVYSKSSPRPSSHRLMITTLLARSISYIWLVTGLNPCSAAGISSLQLFSLVPLESSTLCMTVLQARSEAGKLKKNGGNDFNLVWTTIITNDQVTSAT